MEDPTNTYSTGKHRPQVPAKHSPHPHPQACRDPDSQQEKQRQEKSSSRGEDRQGEGGMEGEEVAAMMVRQSKAALRVEDRSLRLR